MKLTNTHKWLIGGIAVVIVAALLYYFLVYKKKQSDDDEAAVPGTNGGGGASGGGASGGGKSTTGAGGTRSNNPPGKPKTAPQATTTTTRSPILIAQDIYSIMNAPTVTRPDQQRVYDTIYKVKVSERPSLLILYNGMYTTDFFQQVRWKFTPENTAKMATLIPK